MMTPAERKTNRPMPVRRSIPEEKCVIIDFEKYPVTGGKIKEILHMIRLILQKDRTYLLTVRIEEEKGAV